MSIVGIKQTLLVGQNGIRIKSFLKKDIIVEYPSLWKVEYRYSNSNENGYMKFITYKGNEYLFSYKEKSNDSMTRAIDYIKGHSSTTKIEKIKDVSNEFSKLVTDHLPDNPILSVPLEERLAYKTMTNEFDELFIPAGILAFSKGKLSIGHMQRAFKIGFNRAARIYDQFERYGLIKTNGTHPADLLISENDFFEFVNQHQGSENIEIADTNDVNSTQTNTYNDLDRLSGYEFEQFCGNLLEKNGFTNVEVTPSSGDQGIDIVALKNNIKFGIQCKHYSSKVGNKAVQEAFSGAKFYGCHVPIVLTNQEFTQAAIDLSEKIGVVLWGKEELQTLINNSASNNSEKINIV